MNSKHYHELRLLVNIKKTSLQGLIHTIKMLEERDKCGVPPTQPIKVNMASAGQNSPREKPPAVARQESYPENKKSNSTGWTPFSPNRGKPQSGNRNSNQGAQKDSAYRPFSPRSFSPQ